MTIEFANVLFIFHKLKIDKQFNRMHREYRKMQKSRTGSGLKKEWVYPNNYYTITYNTSNSFIYIRSYLRKFRHLGAAK